MKLISLNTWGGRAGQEKLLAFFEDHRDVDVFCLQEIWSASYDHLEGQTAGGLRVDHSHIMTHGLQEISAVLKTHVPYFRPNHLENYGLLIFVKKSIEVLSEGDVFVHKERGFVPTGDVGLHARNVQFVTITTPQGSRTILNFHGLWNGQGKSDSDERLAQSDNIIRLIQTMEQPVVFCGDFNLLPHTESMKKLERIGMRNLIIDYNVTSTRTSLYTKPEKFADYILTSPTIIVNDFHVMVDEVSDHCPLFIDFS